MTGGEIAFLALILAGFGSFMALMAWCTFNPDGGMSKRGAAREGLARGAPATSA